MIARPFGQANAPFDVEEVQRGVVSWIDTIDLDHTGKVDFRAWVRAYEETNEPIYVGIYTVLRRDGVGYVSAGFPLPEGNFTATLLPFANNTGGLLLKSATDLPFSRPLPQRNRRREFNPQAEELRRRNRRLCRPRNTEDRPPFLSQRRPLPHPFLQHRTQARAETQ